MQGQHFVMWGIIVEHTDLKPPLQKCCTAKLFLVFQKAINCPFRFEAPAVAML